MHPGIRTNERITAPEVRLIDDGGNLWREPVAIDKAIVMAKLRGLDLVEVNPNAVPPICKIMRIPDAIQIFESKAKRILELEKENERLRAGIKAVVAALPKCDFCSEKFATHDTHWNDLPLCAECFAEGDHGNGYHELEHVKLLLVLEKGVV